MASAAEAGFAACRHLTRLSALSWPSGLVHRDPKPVGCRQRTCRNVGEALLLLFALPDRGSVTGRMLLAHNKPMRHVTRSFSLFLLLNIDLHIAVFLSLLHRRYCIVPVEVKALLCRSSVSPFRRLPRRLIPLRARSTCRVSRLPLAH